MWSRWRRVDRAGAPGAAAGAEVLLRLEAVPGGVHPVVPDDVHDAHPARERVGVAELVVGERLDEERVGDRPVVGVPSRRASSRRRGRPCAPTSRRCRTERSVPPYTPPRATSHRPSGDGPGLVLAGAGPLRLVRRVGLDGHGVPLRGRTTTWPARARASRQAEITSGEHRHQSPAHVPSSSPVRHGTRLGARGGTRGANGKRSAHRAACRLDKPASAAQRTLPKQRLSGESR